MSSPAKNEMDVDAFLAWADGRQGRWELRDGHPLMMAPERAAHALTKFAAQKALESGLQRAGLPCRVFPDGMTVRITPRTAFEPDALVVCPAPSDLNTMEIPNPGRRCRCPVAEHGRGRSRGQARRLFFAAERGALPHS
jgi:Uma2 family endonuclease